MFFKRRAKTSLYRNNAPYLTVDLQPCYSVLCALHVSQVRIDALFDQLLLKNVEGLSAFYASQLSDWTAKIGGEKYLASYMPAQKAKNDYERINKKLASLKEKMETATDTVNNYQPAISLFKNLAQGAFSNCTETHGKMERVNNLTPTSCNLDNFKRLALPLIEVYQKDINIMLEELNEKCLLDELKKYIDQFAKDFQQTAERSRKNCHPSKVMIELTNVATWGKDKIVDEIPSVIRVSTP
jgi:hypothetical protein